MTDSYKEPSFYNLIGTQNDNLMPFVRIALNIGAGLDVLNGSYVNGTRGERILNGGIGHTLLVAGKANQGKTKLLQYATAKFLRNFPGGTASVTDTEMTSTYQAWMNFFDYNKAVSMLVGKSPLDVEQCRLELTDSTNFENLDTWWDFIKLRQDDRAKKRTLTMETPFQDRDGKPMMILHPTLNFLDSISDGHGKGTDNILEDTDLTDSKANTLHLNDNREKTRLFMEMIPRCQKHYNYSLMSAHVSKNANIGSVQPVAKVYSGLPQDIKISGVPNKALYKTSASLYISKQEMLSMDDKTPRYPLNDFEKNNKDSSDLKMITLTMLRAKGGGGSDTTINIVYSQSMGVLEGLTNFHRCYSAPNNFGVTVSGSNYAMELLPEVSFTRMNVRKKLDEDYKLFRACEITSELLLLRRISTDPQVQTVWVTPEDLYKGLKERGYDWNVLLETRGFWTMNVYEPHMPHYLSTLDLLRMNAGLYKPYWMKDEK